MTPSHDTGYQMAAVLAAAPAPLRARLSTKKFGSLSAIIVEIEAELVGSRGAGVRGDGHGLW